LLQPDQPARRAARAGAATVVDCHDAHSPDQILDATAGAAVDAAANAARGCAATVAAWPPSHQTRNPSTSSRSPRSTYALTPRSSHWPVKRVAQGHLEFIPSASFTLPDAATALGFAVQGPGRRGRAGALTARQQQARRRGQTNPARRTQEEDPALGRAACWPSPHARRRSARLSDHGKMTVPPTPLASVQMRALECRSAAHLQRTTCGSATPLRSRRTLHRHTNPVGADGRPRAGLALCATGSSPADARLSTLRSPSWARGSPTPRVPLSSKRILLLLVFMRRCAGRAGQPLEAKERPLRAHLHEAAKSHTPPRQLGGRRGRGSRASTRAVPCEVDRRLGGIVFDEQVGVRCRESRREHGTLERPDCRPQGVGRRRAARRRVGVPCARRRAPPSESCRAGRVGGRASQREVNSAMACSGSGWARDRSSLALAIASVWRGSLRVPSPTGCWRSRSVQPAP
jgi:hypothetical protein